MTVLSGRKTPASWGARKRALEAVQQAREHGGVVILQGRRGAGQTSILHTVYEQHRPMTTYLRVERWVRHQPMALFEQLIERTLPTTARADFLTALSKAPDSGEQQLVALCHELLELWQHSDEQLVLVDDLHLADHASQNLVSYVASRVADTGVTLVLALPDHLEHVSADLAGLVHTPMTTRVDITALEPGAMQQLAQTLGFYGLDEAALTELRGHTGGWLDYVVQTLQSLPNGQWPNEPGKLPVPSRVVDEIMHAVEQTENPDVWKLVCALATVEGHPGLAILAQIADVTDLVTAIDDAVASGVLRDGVLREAFNTDQLQLEFAHPMATEVLRRRMLPSEQRHYHLRAAEFLDNHGERLLHRAASTLTRDPVLGGELTRYAERLARTGRWDQAARFRFAAARLMSSVSQRESEVLRGVDALTSAGQITRASPWIPTLEAMPPSAPREAALGHLALHQGRATDAGARLAQAQASATDSDVHAVVALRRALDMLCRWDAAGTVQWADRAAALSKPGEAAQVEALAIRGVGLAGQGWNDSADASILRASLTATDGPQHQRFRLCAGWVALLEGDLRTAHREFEVARHTEARGGSLRISLWAQAWLARIQFLTGDWDTALQGALDGISRAEHSGITLMVPMLEWTAREIQLWRDETPRETSWSFTSMNQLRGYTSMLIPARMIQAVTAKVKLDHDGGIAALMPLVELDPWGPDQMSFWPWQPELIQALVGADRLAEAAEISEQFTAHTTTAARYVRAVALGSAARVAAAQKDTDGAEALFLQALRLTEQDGLSTYHGRYLFALGQLLRRAGRRREAAKRLASAREFFSGVQATVMIEHCDRELRATGMLQYRSADPGPTGGDGDAAIGVGDVELTPQEHAIAQLVVQGLTNRETARSLFIAEKTVQYHLTRIYAKFSIRSRTELAKVYIPDDPVGEVPTRADSTWFLDDL